LKTIIIYSSTHHGNTEKVAHAIGDVLKADLHSLEKEKPSSISLEGYDLIGLGTGVKATKPYRKMMQAVDKLDLADRKVFLFSTSAGNNLAEILPLKEKVMQKGARLAGEFMCAGFFDWAFVKWFNGGYNKGHPDTADLENARKFAKSLVN
jgi:flavodoxin